MIAPATSARSVTRSSGRQPGPISVPAPLASQALWDDGRAELSLYRGRIDRYGHRRDLEARIIVVKEDLDRRERIKSERGPIPGRTVTVLKIVYQQTFTTGVYTYHQASTTFLDRSTLDPWKLMMTSFESCGITTVEVLPRGDIWRHVSHSYFEGEGDRSSTIRNTQGAVLWDGLSFWLRNLELGRAQSFAIRLLPSQVSNRARATKLVVGRIRVRGRAETIEVPAGRRGAYPVDVEYPLTDSMQAANDVFWFDAEAPHVLLRLERPSLGYEIELTRTQRLAYWTKNRPGDEALLAR